jgi:hypothetical protein
MIAFFIFPPLGLNKQAFDGNIIAQRFVGQMSPDLFDRESAETGAFTADVASDITNVSDAKAAAGTLGTQPVSMWPASQSLRRKAHFRMKAISNLLIFADM